jgi:diguanylate cyclase (GGDEF)-like protein
MLGRENAQGREHAIGHPAVTDPQTGLANRLHFELVYSYIFAAGNRGVTFSVMLISVGDSLDEEHLQSSGEKIERTTRDSDLVAYLGGGRFVVLLLGTNLPGARVAADRVEMTLSDDDCDAVSIGLAAYSPEMRQSSELLEAVDKAVSAAEAAGGGIEFG